MRVGATSAVAASAEVVDGKGPEQLVEEGDSDGEEAVASSVQEKEVSEGAGVEGRVDSVDWEDCVLNGYAGTVGAVGCTRVGNGGTAGTVGGSGSEDGSDVFARRTEALRSGLRS